MPEAASSIDERDPHPGRTGVLVLVVGPSGAGKDTLIDAARASLRHDDRFYFPVRAITRPEGPGENHQPMTHRLFEDAEVEGEFFLTWRAHGLSYGLPAAVGDALKRGDVVVVNTSRTVIDEARKLWPEVRVLHITADAAQLTARLTARGRESSDEIAARVARADVYAVASLGSVERIENSGDLETAAAHFEAVLRRYASEPESGKRSMT